MSGTICPSDELDMYEPSSTYHVKGAFLENLLQKYSAKNVAGLNKILKIKKYTYGYWSEWSKCTATACGIGRSNRQLRIPKQRTKSEARECAIRKTDGTLIECKIIPEISHGWMSWGEWSQCSKTCKTGGIQTRSRTCGTCDDADDREVYYFRRENHKSTFKYFEYNS